MNVVDMMQLQLNNLDNRIQGCAGAYVSSQQLDSVPHLFVAQ